MYGYNLAFGLYIICKPMYSMKTKKCVKKVQNELIQELLKG
jgi:hypothetical protein